MLFFYIDCTLLLARIGCFEKEFIFHCQMLNDIFYCDAVGTFDVFYFTGEIPLYLSLGNLSISQASIQQFEIKFISCYLQPVEARPELITCGWDSQILTKYNKECNSGTNGFWLGLVKILSYKNLCIEHRYSPTSNEPTIYFKLDHHSNYLEYIILTSTINSLYFNTIYIHESQRDK